MTRSRRPSPRLLVALGFFAAFMAVVAAADKSPGNMATAANRFLSSLSVEQRQQATFPFNSDERLRWHFIPTETFPRNGLQIKAMNEPQRKAARDLIAAGLSQRGYLTATSIMELEALLGEIEAAARAARPPAPAGGRGGGGNALVRDPEKYFVSIFGTPSPKDAWGWRVEGHHVSLHFTVVNGTLVASSPTFFGSNPAEVRDGPKKGLRLLGDEEDAARALVLALDAKQRQTAIIQATAPNDILTEAKLDISPLSPVGVAAGAMTAQQRELLMKLVQVYVGFMADDIAADRMARLKSAGLDKIAFAWGGETERGKKHYYRVQGPTFLIEYDNTQNDGNHVHSVWRDFNGDFGRDLLREHLKTVAH